MQRSGWLVLAALLAVGAPAAAQMPGGGMGGGMGGRGGMGGGRMGGGRRGGMNGARSMQNIPTEAEAEGPPDLQTLSLSAGVDTTGLINYGVAVHAYLDSTRAVRDSIWVVLERMRPNPDGTPSAAADSDANGPPPAGARDPEAGGARRGRFAVLQESWPTLKKRDDAFVKSVLKRALPKKEFKKWKKWHDGEVDQAKKDRDDRMQRRMGGGGFRDQ
ncbi:MAG: hypothetical protein ACREOE_01075 [Gemmatimonadales bacterium]